MKKTFLQHNPDPFAELREELEAEMQNLDAEKKQRVEEINKDFSNPLGEEFGY